MTICKYCYHLKLINNRYICTYHSYNNDGRKDYKVGTIEFLDCIHYKKDEGNLYIRDPNEKRLIKC